MDTGLRDPLTDSSSEKLSIAKRVKIAARLQVSNIDLFGKDEEPVWMKLFSWSLEDHEITSHLALQLLKVELTQDTLIKRFDNGHSSEFWLPYILDDYDPAQFAPQRYDLPPLTQPMNDFGLRISITR